MALGWEPKTETEWKPKPLPPLFDLTNFGIMLVLVSALFLMMRASRVPFLIALLFCACLLIFEALKRAAIYRENLEVRARIRKENEHSWWVDREIEIPEPSAGWMAEYEPWNLKNALDECDGPIERLRYCKRYPLTYEDELPKITAKAAKAHNRKIELLHVIDSEAA